MAARPYITLLRLPFQFLLSPIFLFGYLLAGGTLNLSLLVAYLSFHLFLYAGGTALNSFYDRDEGPVGGLANPPPLPNTCSNFRWSGSCLVLCWRSPSIPPSPLSISSCSGCQSP